MPKGDRLHLLLCRKLSSRIEADVRRPINLIGSPGGQSKFDDRYSLTNPMNSSAQQLLALFAEELDARRGGQSVRRRLTEFESNSI